jgi:hypothetical protein
MYCVSTTLSDLARTLRSVVKQSYRPIEVIVVDKLPTTYSPTADTWLSARS